MISFISYIMIHYIGKQGGKGQKTNKMVYTGSLIGNICASTPAMMEYQQEPLQQYSRLLWASLLLRIQLQKPEDLSSSQVFVPVHNPGDLNTNEPTELENKTLY